MNYRKNLINGDELSQLGFGCMRFPSSEKETEQIIKYAIDNGINYFDTAYIYPNSERTLGKILKRLDVREQVKIATKMPPWMIQSYDDFDKVFNKQLERLQTTYIDYYFMHVLTDLAAFEKLRDLGLEKWIAEKKQAGQIKNVGFSYHGGKSEFVKLLDAYDWQFCMIYYNFVDEHNQAGKSGLEYAHSKQIPVMIMGPLAGGRLVNRLPKEVYKLYEKAATKRTAGEWALSWVLNHKEVTLALSGMSSLEDVKANINLVKGIKAGDFTDTEYKMFDEIKAIIASYEKIKCTGCGYCLPCPRGVDIPTCFDCYNHMETRGRYSALKSYVQSTTLKKDPTNAGKCTGCKVCEQHCPQFIPIAEKMREVKKKLEGKIYRPGSWLIRKWMRIK